MTTTQPLAYTVEKAVEVAGGVITLNWLSEAIRRREIEHVRIGRNVGVTPAQLRALIDAYTVKPASENQTEQPAAPVAAAIDIASITPRSRSHHSRKAAR